MVTRLRSLINSRIFREFLGFGSSTALEQAVRIAVSLFAAAVLGPVVWGSWYLLNLIVRYGSLLHLGALNGLNRQYALEVGRGNTQEAEELRKAALGVLMVSIGVAIVIALPIMFVAGLGSLLVTVLLTLALLVCQQLYTFVLMVHKSRIRFSSVSRMQWAAAITTPLFVVPLTLRYGLEGFIVGQAVSYLLLAAFAYATDHRTFEIRFDLGRSKLLIRIGFPIMLVGVLFVLFSTVDRWVVAALLPPEALGYYSLAIMALGGAAMLPQVVAQQYYPRMARAWGASHDLAELGRLAKRQTVGALLPTLVVVAVAQILAPLIVRSFLPEYVPGIAALQIIMLAPIVNCFGQGYANLLNVTDRQYQYMVILLVSIVFNAGASYFLALFWGLNGVAVGTVLAYSIFSASLVLMSKRSAKASHVH